MAGSFLSQAPDDLILSARIEALSLLADHIQEPVVILMPSGEVVYANDSALKIVGACPIIEHDTKSGPVVCESRDQCEVCPAKSVLEGSLMSFQDKPLMENPRSSTCPFSRAMALFRGGGQVGSVVMMGKNVHGTMVYHSAMRAGQTGGPESPESADQKLIGGSAVMEQVVELIKVVASSEAPVLLEGESGTGKELAARTIHQFSVRKDRPFVVVDCGSLPETLLESELFGHVRGAFTGAVASRKGLFEEAHGGTIFLDEISNTGPAFQAKLLRVLQEGEIKPVGSNLPVRVDIRVLSATNTPLEKLVKSKLFRADLYYRLAVLPITLPPLRDRLEDIPLLVTHFVRRSCVKSGRPLIHVLPEAHQELMSRVWPGNIRELEHVIERAVLMAGDSPLTRRDVLACDMPVVPLGDLGSVGRGARAQVERVRILEALRESQGSRTKAAKLLNISRAGLYNKLREYHLS